MNLKDTKAVNIIVNPPGSCSPGQLKRAGMKWSLVKGKGGPWYICVIPWLACGQVSSHGPYTPGLLHHSLYFVLIWPRPCDKYMFIYCCYHDSSAIICTHVHTVFMTKQGIFVMHYPRYFPLARYIRRIDGHNPGKEYTHVLCQKFVAFAFSIISDERELLVCHIKVGPFYFPWKVWVTLKTK